MSQVLSGVSPTRMELIRLRRRRRIAERGGELLREKLDALLLEFFQFAREIRDLRSKTQDRLFQAYREFVEAQMRIGITGLEEASVGSQDRFDVNGSTRSIIGVSIPYVKFESTEVSGVPYGLLTTTPRLDDAYLSMSETLRNIAQLSAAESAIRRLAEAISSTRRRVNSLQYVVIPTILATIRYIEMHLQEREREDFFRLKRIKKRLQEVA